MLACAVDDQACNHRVLFRDSANAVNERCFCSSRSMSNLVRVIRTVLSGRVCTPRSVTSLPVFAVIVLRVFSHPADGRMHSAIIYIHMRVRNAELGAKLRVASHEKLTNLLQAGSLAFFNQEQWRINMTRTAIAAALVSAFFFAAPVLAQNSSNQGSSANQGNSSQAAPGASGDQGTTGTTSQKKRRMQGGAGQSNNNSAQPNSGAPASHDSQTSGNNSGGQTGQTGAGTSGQAGAGPSKQNGAAPDSSTGPTSGQSGSSTGGAAR